MYAYYYYSSVAKMIIGVGAAAAGAAAWRVILDPQSKTTLSHVVRPQESS